MKNVYDYILQGDNATEKNARQAADQLVWSEIETSDQNIKYHKYVDTINGVEIYYDYGADYYFFTEVGPEEITEVK